jgi:hypothetical protein
MRIKEPFVHSPKLRLSPSTMTLTGLATTGMVRRPGMTLVTDRHPAGVILGALLLLAFEKSKNGPPVYRK